MPSEREVYFAMAAYRKSAVENGHEGPDERAIRAALETAELTRSNVVGPDGGVIVPEVVADALKLFLKNEAALLEAD